MSRADRLLSCALSFREAPTREAALPPSFETAAQAAEQMTAVLLHEAHEAMREALGDAPETPALHPVDLDTEAPGIVDDGRIRRPPRASLPRVAYGAASRAERQPPPAAFARDADAAESEARDLHKAQLRAARQSAKAGERREAAREARAAETAEERRARLDEAKRKREARKRETLEAEAAREATPEAEAAREPPAKRKPPRAPPAPSDDALVSVDLSSSSLLRGRPPARVAKEGQAHYFEHPLPHDRHLSAMAACRPHKCLLPALLGGAACEALQVIQGPPGTGKTRALVDLVPAGGRVLLCAPTNVGAANLYRRLVDAGHGAEAALALAPDRVPPGTAVLSNDPSRRLVCATVSARAGAALDRQAFETVLVDEAAMLMEAWTWTLLRAEVTQLVLAGDVRQLPALASESGRALRHERSLMERLAVDLGYANVRDLRAQNRMAPEVMALANALFYEWRLELGPHAPARGELVLVRADGAEEQIGTSRRNLAEADAVARCLEAELAEGGAAGEVVALAPYHAQCRALLARCGKRAAAVHTVDSFQGREADTVVLSVVRDGSAGLGFWEDARRAAVAFTRARTKLVLVCSHPERWPEDSALRRAAAMIEAA